MAKEMFNLEGCLHKTKHHVDSHKVGLMMSAGAGREDFEYRNQMVHANLVAVLAQVKKIRDTAEKHGYKEIIALLDEKTLPAGHDLGTVAAAMSR